MSDTTATDALVELREAAIDRCMEKARLYADKRSLATCTELMVTIRAEMLALITEAQRQERVRVQAKVKEAKAYYRLPATDALVELRAAVHHAYGLHNLPVNQGGCCLIHRYYRECPHIADSLDALITEAQRPNQQRVTELEELLRTLRFCECEKCQTAAAAALHEAPTGGEGDA